MELREENMNNLLSLWRVAGLRTGKYVQNEQFELSIVEDSEWPNRLWYQREVCESILQRSIDVLGEHQSMITIPLWGSNLSILPVSLTKLGFEEKFSQVGMSIRLDRDFDSANSIELIKVSNELSARLWAELFQKAFGYRISTNVIIETKDVISYLIGFQGEIPVGTSVLYIHQSSIAGIHAMGIVPEKRRLGFAEEMVKQQLQMAAAAGAEYATLQASDMGKGLYLKLGFEEQFIIKNFARH